MADPNALADPLWALVSDAETFGRDDLALVEEWATDLQERLPVMDGKKVIQGSVRGREFADAVMRLVNEFKRMKAEAGGRKP